MSDKIRIKKIEKLSDQKFTLNNVIYDYQKKNGEYETQKRETYDHGNGASVFLYNTQQRTIILTRQLRIATYLNGNPDGMLLECCAGMLDNNDPEKAIIKEIEEETGYRVNKVNKVMQVYMSPGANTEMLHFFIAEYNNDQKVNAGGGLQHEQEEIEVLEVSFDEAYRWLQEGKIKDAKTVILLQYARINGLV